MAATAPGLTRRNLETRLIERAWKDPGFRKQIITDPKGLLERRLGQKLPEELKISVHEEDANTLHFSIPAPPSNTAELSDEDLEKVAGGTGDLSVATAETALLGVTVSVMALGTFVMITQE
jgi:hypothetical protein